MPRSVYWASYRLYSIARRLLRLLVPARSVRYILGPISGRVVYWLSATGQRPLDVHGHQMYVASAGRYPPIDMTADQYERSTTRLFELLVSPGMTVVDIGAHVGYYSLLAARSVGPAGRIYAFEPEPQNRALLQKNVALNRYTNIRVQPAAVTNRSGTMTLYVSALDNGSHSLHHVGKPEHSSVEVPVTTLDAFLAGEGWPRVDLIKMDIEGSEVEALEGMRILLQRQEQLILIVELCPSILRSAGVASWTLLRRLQALNFQVYVLLEQGMIAQEHAGLPGLVERLLRSGDYVNLVCAKGGAQQILDDVAIVPASQAASTEPGR